jgi:membrane associated rhomboid family serine protease
MTSGADLFVVCKHCGSEVSPYITECPYCGHRLRRRAPKLPRESEPKRPRPRLLRRSGARSPGSEPSPMRSRARVRRPGRSLAGAISTRPYATISVVAASSVLWVLVRAGYIGVDNTPGCTTQACGVRELAVIGPLHGDWWKLFTSQFVYLNGLLAFVALITIALFGWLLEQRLGAIVVLVLVLAAGATGALVAIAVYPGAVVTGGNAAALALLAAWAAPDLRAARAGEYYEGDLLGAGALAALLLAIPFVRPEVSWLAGVTGGLLGLLAGLGLQRPGHAEL